MTPATKYISIIFLGLILFFAANWWQNSISKADVDSIKLGNVTFYTSIDNGINESINQSKPIFLYFRSDACYWCIRFEEEALWDPRVIDILKKNFVLVSIDQIKQKNVAFNLGVRSTPYMIFFTKDGEEITRVPGYLQTEDFLFKLNEVTVKLERNN